MYLCFQLLVVHRQFDGLLMSSGVICRGMNTRDDFMNQDISRSKVSLVYGDMFLREHWASVFSLEV